MAFVLDLVVSITSLAIIGCYVWSMRSHFSSPDMPSGAKWLSLYVILTAAALLVLLWLYDQPLWMQLAGLALELASAALFWWAIFTSRAARLRYAFDPEGPRGLVTSGPYRYLRHPFYTSYLLFWSGWAFATASPTTIVPVAIFIAIYVTAARREENLFAQSAMATDYHAYRRRTGFLLPRFSSSKGD